MDTIAACVHDSDMGIAEKLRLARERRGMSQPDLARVSGVGQGSISNYENGAAIPLKKAAAIARACGVPVDWLVDDSAPDDPPALEPPPPAPSRESVALSQVVEILGVINEFGANLLGKL